MEKHVLRLTEEQRRLGHEVTIAFNSGQASSLNDIRVLPWVNLRTIRPQAVRDLCFYSHLISKISAQGSRFDIVHVHGDWSAFLFGRLVARAASARTLIGSLHGAARQGKWRAMYRFALNGYSMVYATGSREAQYIGSLTGRPVRWQHSGIDAVLFTNDISETPNRTIDVVSAGSFVPCKNYELVVEVACAMPNVTFLLIGDGPRRCAIEAQCRRRGISNITFAGHLPPADVAQQLRHARIYLQTSLSEGTPTALLEGMACGLAVITSQSNDYEELIQPGQNGFVIEGFRAEPYVRRIQELLGNENRLHEIARRNSKQALRYGWSDVAKRITEWSMPDAIDQGR
ncbi:glycosyltransferase family 4 protein [Candidatus Methylomirabilis sp.]|uniref:Glycosyltransferase family 4 protein n=1 Tax=Candidatus Methylomirabilis tolerans TaxID=3123416 RepID=A0AAJ1ALH0_9BACT|nr:glycosyltransferase family 4 protein [Candidatus Methylomirabilis sp.]